LGSGDADGLDSGVLLDGRDEGGVGTHLRGNRGLGSALMANIGADALARSVARGGIERKP
jgi:hypothetical protein